MISLKNDGVWISRKIEQETADADWVKYQPILEGRPKEIKVNEDQSTKNMFITDTEIVEGDYIIMSDGTVTNEGVIGPVIGGAATDISNCTYDTISKTVSSQEDNPKTFAFNKSGSKMFVAGGDKKLYQYDLSTPFDVASASYSYVYVDFDNITSSGNVHRGWSSAHVHGLTVSDDGLHMYATSHHDVYQFNMTIPFDISTLTYDDEIYETYCEGDVFITKDGVTLFTIDGDASYIEQHHLSTPFDITTASKTHTLNARGELKGAQGITFNEDGTRMYLVGKERNTIYQYILGTGFDVSTATYDNNSFYVGAQEGRTSSLNLNAEGTKLYILGYGTAKVRQYSINGCVNGAYGFDCTSFLLQSAPIAAYKRPTRVFVALESTLDRVISYDKELDFVSSTTTQIVGKSAIPGLLTLGDDIKINVGGTLTTLNPTDIVEGTTALTNINSASPDGITASFDSLSTTLDATGMAFNTDGTRVFVISAYNSTVYQGDLSTAWDISTITWAGTFSVITQQSAPTDIAFNDSGTKMYICGTSPGQIHEYNVPSSFNITSAYYDDKYFDISTESLDVQDLFFYANGTKMVVVDTDYGIAARYSLNSSYDITTASYDSVNFDLTSQTTEPKGVTFNKNGSKMYVQGEGINDKVYQYSLATAFDIDTATYDSVEYNVQTEENTPNDIYFNSDGTKMYILGKSGSSGAGGNKITQYSVNGAINQIHQYTCELPVQASAPTQLIIPDRMVESVPRYSFEYGSLKQTHFAFLKTGRVIQFKVIGDIENNVSRLGANMWQTV